MELIRSKAGANDFSITGLTLGKLQAIEHMISEYLSKGTYTSVEREVYMDIYTFKLDKIEQFGDSHLKKEIIREQQINEAKDFFQDRRETKEEAYERG